MTSPTDYDPHWRPYWIHCSPCLVNYDFVLKIETMQEDFEKLKNLVDLPDALHLETKTVSLEVSRSDEGKVVRAHLMQLTPPEKRKLIERFKEDFDLFNYDPEIY